MLIGWAKIRQEIGLTERVVKRLVEEEEFPIYYISGRPVTSSSLVGEWLRVRVELQRSGFVQ